MEKKFNELKNRLKEVDNLNSAAAVLGWDQATYMPPGGAAARGRQLATLASLAQEKFIDPAVGKLLDDLQNYETGLDYDSDEADGQRGASGIFGYRTGNSARSSVAHFRSLFHDQRNRKGNRARTIALSWHHRAPRWAHPGSVGAGRGVDVAAVGSSQLSPRATHLSDGLLRRTARIVTHARSRPRNR